MASVEIKGLNKCVYWLRVLGQNVDGIIDNSLKESANIIKQEVEENVRKVTASYNGHTYKAVDTGDLLRSITVNKLGLCRYAVVATAEHSIYVEFGTSIAGDPAVAHTTRPKWVYYNENVGEYRTAYPQPPRPYMRPAFVARKNTVILNMILHVKRAAANSYGGEL